MKSKLSGFAVTLLLAITMASFTSDKETLYKEVEGIKITYTKQQKQLNATETAEYLIVKISNNNSYAVRLSWKLDLWYNGNCRTCDKPSPSGYEFELNLKPGETITGDINKDDLMLKIWSKSIKPAREGGLTRFEFTNLMVSKN